MIFNSFFLDIDSLDISPEGEEWRFTGFYGHLEKAQRHPLWKLLRRLRGLFTLPWLAAEDFNEIVHFIGVEKGAWKESRGV
ncbi:hypothetical protein TIFTF001_004285 [Ficus carica]|uniref:Uncharacterized protein n=1 Tax=Ficus carica TaxID=3494 RepID=A0AA88CSY3_FICCA|nr:hypothetical protein TIFTF001_004285 [Ficus carica]